MRGNDQPTWRALAEPLVLIGGLLDGAVHGAPHRPPAGYDQPYGRVGSLRALGTRADDDQLVGTIHRAPAPARAGLPAAAPPVIYHRPQRSP